MIEKVIVLMIWCSLFSIFLRIRKEWLANRAFMFYFPLWAISKGFRNELRVVWKKVAGGETVYWTEYDSDHCRTYYHSLRFIPEQGFMKFTKGWTDVYAVTFFEARVGISMSAWQRWKEIKKKSSAKSEMAKYWRDYGD